MPWATLPAATQCGQPAATLGWAQPRVRCCCGSGVGPEPSNTARHGFILPDSRLPAGMPKSLWSLQQGEMCLQRAAQSDLFCCFFLLTWPTSGCRRQTGLRRAVRALTFGRVPLQMESWWLSALAPHLAPQRYGMGAVIP